MMKYKWISKKMKYDGTQLRPLFAYEEYHLLGDSVISWQGPCDISFEQMKDLEDVIALSSIRGANMLHFIVEVFHQNLFSGVTFQRLIAAIIKDVINEILSAKKIRPLLIRQGDDLYSKDKKLSISIASQSILATQIHFALNITNEGTPVKTVSLQDFNIEPKMISVMIMKRICDEFSTIVEATKKVRSL